MNEQREGKLPDHESDPAHNTDPGSDWADEGGATDDGPATHVESGHPHHDDEE